MSDTTTHLSMPFILPSQAQKHVTHNEALLALDAIVQMRIDGEAASPPPSPTDGSRYAVALAAQGAWTGHDGQIAVWQDGAWQFLVPRQGWLAWFSAKNLVKVFAQDGWRDLPLPAAEPDLAVSTLGVNAGADAGNRLAVASPASLFNHEGHGHQVKVNKAAAPETATVLFQSNWTGHAEMGLAGDNTFSVKVSDGTDWKTGLTIDGDGVVTQPNRPAALAFSAYEVFSPTANTLGGFTMLDPAQGGMSLGEALPAGGRAVIIPATGLYLLTLMMVAVASSGHSFSVVRNGGLNILFSLSAPAAVPISLSHTHLVHLDAGDALSVLYGGSAQFVHGRGLSELSILMI